jgi:hypothetical protein
MLDLLRKAQYIKFLALLRGSVICFSKTQDYGSYAEQLK